MGVPQNLLNFTSPVVTQALKTGARGSTTTNTDYGVIGDAFFKKAQLELGIANLQADLGVKTAEIKSGLEMENAHLNLAKAQMLLDYDLKKKENDVGFFEGLFGTLEGAASGAIAGTAIGGPGAGTVIGAIAGGGATAVGYAAEGKKGGEAARSMLGTVSKAAVAIKGFNQEQKSKDGWAGLMKTGAEIMSNMNRPGQTPEQMQQNQVDWANHLAGVNSFQVTDLGMNPQQAAQGTQGYASSLQGYDATDPKAKANADMARRSMEFAGIENPTRDDYKKFWADQSVNFHNATGEDMSQQYFSGMVESSHPGLGSMMQGRAGTSPARQAQTRDRQLNDPAQNPPTMETPSVGDLTPSNPRSGRSTQQPQNPNQQSGTIPILGASASGPVGTNYRTPQISGGVQMDDGGEITVADIQKQGDETVKALQSQKKEEGIADRSTHLEGLDWLVPDTETASGNKKIDEKIAASKERTEKLIQLKQKSTTESVEGPEEIAQREQERAIRHPGVKEARSAERVELEKKAPVIDKMPEKDVAQRNTKKGLRDAVYAAGHLDEIMEKIPDDLYTRFSQFVKSEGVGIKSPHISADILDEVAKALVDTEAEEVFSDDERDLLNEWVSESYNLAYADSLMDAGSRGVSSDQMKMSKTQMPGFGDDYRERSNKLRILMRGYGERIHDASESQNNEGERLDLESKRMRNRKQAEGLSGKSKSKANDWWKDIAGG